jgi:hypothetical protein
MNTTQVQEVKVGDIITYSYGYDMTINVYAKIIAKTPKGFKAVAVQKNIMNDDGMGNGRSVPVDTPVAGAEPFTLRVGTYHNGDRAYLAGKGQHWDLWDGQPDYYNTWD